MRRLAIALAVAALFAIGCDEPTKSAPTTASASAPAKAIRRASIRLSEDFDMLKSADSGYVIEPADELTLEPGDRKLGEGDTQVHVAQGASGYFRADLKRGAPAILSAATLDPVKGGAFAGFEPGDYVVAIGREEPSKDGVLRFVPTWSAKIQVKQGPR